MAASVSISTESPQTSGWPFDVDVIVNGAPPGAKVAVRLEQTNGTPPLWGPVTKTKTVGGSGTVIVPFSVTLQGPTDAQLQSTVTDDQGTNYPQATKDIQVL
jgi:hypothetical protein